jgi:hypothetical protein
MPLVVSADAEKLLTDFIQTVITGDYLPTPPVGSAWKRGTTVAPGVTPKWFIQVRSIGGEDAGRVADRPLLDVRVWADGTAATEALRSQAARVLLARIRQRFPCNVFAAPVPLPDPVDPSKVHTLFTVRLLTRGVQSA